MLLWNVQSLNINKSHSALEYLLEKQIDIVCLSETWFYDERNYQTALFEDGNYKVFNRPRVTDTIGGAVCILINNRFKTTQLKRTLYSSFEFVSVVCSVSNMHRQKLKIVLIYRREAVVFSTFIDEFSSFLQDILLSKYSFVIGGDFNIHMNEFNHSYTKRFHKMCKEFDINLSNVTSSRTHIAGNVIDFIVSDSLFASKVQNIHIDEDAPSISHHYPITYIVDSCLQSRKLAEQTSRRSFRNFEMDNLKNDLSESLKELNTKTSFLDKVTCFQHKLQVCYDSHAPIKVSNIILNERPSWMDHDYVVQRAYRRKLERKFKQSRSAEDEINLKLQRTKCSLLVKQKRDENIHKHAVSCKGNTRSLFQMYDKLVGDGSSDCNDMFDVDSNNSSILANTFNKYFTDKVQKVQSHIEANLKLLPIKPVPSILPLNSDTTTTSSGDNSILSDFRPADLNELRDIIKEHTVKTTYQIDPLPSDKMSQCIDCLLPYLLDLVNTSLQSGSVDGVKFSHIKPLLKKLGLDFWDHSSYRPISNLAN